MERRRIQRTDTMEAEAIIEKTPEQELIENWVEACSQSNQKFIDRSWQGIQAKCSESDGEPCRFLRGKGYGGFIMGWVCLFSRCIKRYPTDEDLEPLK
jgi:hypothetical protein